MHKLLFYNNSITPTGMTIPDAV